MPFFTPKPESSTPFGRSLPVLAIMESTSLSGRMYTAAGLHQAIVSIYWG